MASGSPKSANAADVMHPPANVNGELFPYLPAIALRCAPLSVSADCKQVCKCDDNSEYAIKEAAVQETMPHNEWLCASLAERVGIAAPPFKVVKIKGVNCFGSRWLAGEQADWWVHAKGGLLKFDDIAPAISRILVFDLFVHNIDRHLRNYFVFRQRIGHSILAMDFGRSWLFSGMPLPPLPMQDSDNTIVGIRSLKKLFGDFLIISEMDDVLNRLNSVTHTEIDGFISNHPVEWLKEKEKHAIKDWWQSSHRTDRIEAIRTGVKDGSLL